MNEGFNEAALGGARKAVMCHDSIDLTMQTYTDPKLLDVAGALDALPMHPLDDDSADRQKATGTDARSLVPMLALKSDKQRISGATADKPGERRRTSHGRGADSETPCFIDEKRPLSSADNGRPKKRAKGLEPSTFSLEGNSGRRRTLPEAMSSP